MFKGVYRKIPDEKPQEEMINQSYTKERARNQ